LGIPFYPQNAGLWAVAFSVILAKAENNKKELQQMPQSLIHCNHLIYYIFASLYIWQTKKTYEH
jgi:hypothetical protein